jgi:hypothetical protein
MDTHVENNKDPACPTKRENGDGDGRMEIRLYRRGER